MSIFSGLWSGGLARNQSILDAQKLALDSEYERGRTAFDQRQTDGGVAYNAYLERTGYQGNPQTTQNLNDYAASRNAMNQQQAQRESNYQQNYLGNPQQRAQAAGNTSLAGPTMPAKPAAQPMAQQPVAQSPMRNGPTSFGLPTMKPTAQPGQDRVINSFDSNGNKVQGFAQGGVVGMHPGEPRGTDTVPAWLTPGEAVLTKEATALLGPERIEALNTAARALMGGQMDGMPQESEGAEYRANGGLIQPKYYARGARKVSFGDDSYLTSELEALSYGDDAMLSEDPHNPVTEYTQNRDALRSARQNLAGTLQNVAGQKYDAAQNEYQTRGAQRALLEPEFQSQRLINQPSGSSYRPRPASAGPQRQLSLNFGEGQELMRVDQPTPLGAYRESMSEGYPGNLSRQIGKQFSADIPVGQHSNLGTGYFDPDSMARQAAFRQQAKWTSETAAANRQPPIVEPPLLSSYDANSPQFKEALIADQPQGRVFADPRQKSLNFNPQPSDRPITDMGKGSSGPRGSDRPMSWMNKGSAGKQPAIPFGQQGVVRSGVGQIDPSVGPRAIYGAAKEGAQTIGNNLKNAYKTGAMGRGAGRGLAYLQALDVGSAMAHDDRMAMGRAMLGENANPDLQRMAGTVGSFALNAADAPFRFINQLGSDLSMGRHPATGLREYFGLGAPVNSFQYAGELYDKVKGADQQPHSVSNDPPIGNKPVVADGTKNGGYTNFALDESGRPQWQNVPEGWQSYLESMPEELPQDPQQAELARAEAERRNYYVTGGHAWQPPGNDITRETPEAANAAPQSQALAPRKQPNTLYAADKMSDAEIDRRIGLQRQGGTGVDFNGGSVSASWMTPEIQGRIEHTLRSAEKNKLREQEAMMNWENSNPGKKGRISHAGFVNDGNFIITEDDGGAAPDLSETTMKYRDPAYRSGLISPEDRQAAIERAGTTDFSNRGRRTSVGTQLWTEYPDEIDTGAALDIEGYRDMQKQRDYDSWAKQHPKQALERERLRNDLWAHEQDFALRGRANDLQAEHNQALDTNARDRLALDTANSNVDRQQKVRGNDITEANNKAVLEKEYARIEADKENNAAKIAADGRKYADERNDKNAEFVAKGKIARSSIYKTKLTEGSSLTGKGVSARDRAAEDSAKAFSESADPILEAMTMALEGSHDEQAKTTTAERILRKNSNGELYFAMPNKLKGKNGKTRGQHIISRPGTHELYAVDPKALADDVDYSGEKDFDKLVGMDDFWKKPYVTPLRIGDK